MRLRHKQPGGYSVNDWRIIFSAIIQLPLLAVSLRLFGYKKTRFFLSHFIPNRQPKSTNHCEQKTQAAEHLANLVSIAASFGPYKANCLKKALLIWFLLRKRNISTIIRIGIRRDLNGKYLSHAWIEYGGQPLIDSPETGDVFTVFQSDKL